MTDADAKRVMTDLSHTVTKKIPNRPFFVFVWPDTSDGRALYVGNGDPKHVVTAMRDFISHHEHP